jgi:glycosyltransferase involved in cell wall biosynthesis
MESLLADAAARRDLSARGRRRALEWRARRPGRELLDLFARTVAAGRRRMAIAASGAPRPRLALWSPVPPQRSGVADYAEELLRQLLAWADVEVFVDEGFLPSAELIELAPTHLFTAFSRRHARKPFDAALAQVGASRLHLFVEHLKAEVPVVTTVHDLNWGALRHAVAEVTASVPALFRSVAELDSPDAAAELAEILAGDDPGSALDQLFAREPLLGPVAARSAALVVHVPRLAAELRKRYPHVPVHHFPMGVDDPHRALWTGGENGLRLRLGTPAHAFVVGAFGIVDASKRILSLVRAIARLRERAPGLDVELWLVGELADSAYETAVREELETHGLTGVVRRFGGVSRRDFDLALLGCDVVVNLRHPFRGQMSATVMRALAAEKPVLVSAGTGWELPEGSSRLVPTDGREVEVLADELAELAAGSERRRDMGRLARAWWREAATPAVMSGHYRRVVGAVLSGRRGELRASV